MHQVFVFILFLIFINSCTHRNKSDSDLVNISTCENKIDVASLLQDRHNCSNSKERKRFLYNWIPCNKVTRYSYAENIENTNEDIVTYLKNAPSPISESMIEELFKNPERRDFSWMQNNPILKRPIAKAANKIISEAKEMVFFDVFLLGGTWGLSLVRDLILATKRGIDVIVIRDNDNNVGIHSEMVPLWNRFLSYAKTRKNLVVMRSDITRHPSGLPLGINKIIQEYDQWLDLPISLSGKSDHSKTIISDPFSTQPKMLVGSKNMTDHAGSFFYDEAFMVEGPAAAGAFIAYLPDIRWARLLSVVEGQDWNVWIDILIDKMIQRRKNKIKTLIPPAGNQSVLLMENNAEDSVRNVEHTILSLIKSAKKTIEVYNFLSYGPAMSQALQKARDRGVKVRILLDSLKIKANYNASIVVFMEDAGASGDRDSYGIRWRKVLPPIKFPKESKRISMAQQQHIKTVIVDDKIVTAGSANFDAATFAGAFRELSVAVKDPILAKKMRQDFDKIYNSESTSMSFNEGIKSLNLDPNTLKSSVFRDTLRLETSRINALKDKDLLKNCSVFQ